MAVCVPYLVEILVTLSHDPYPQVSLVARASLKQFPAGDHTLKSLLGEQLHALTSSLPRLIRQHDDTRYHLYTLYHTTCTPFTIPSVTPPTFYSIQKSGYLAALSWLPEALGRSCDLTDTFSPSSL